MKVFSFVKNKWSKSVEPKSKYIFNFSLRKALCFVFVLFCCLGMWGQTVVEYKSKSSLSELNWLDPDSWEGGSVPNISGDKEVTIYLNANMVAQSSDQNSNKETIILHFNSEGSKEIHIYLNGYEVNVKNAIQIGKNAYSTNGGNLILHGNGSMSTEVLEFGKGSEIPIFGWQYPENKLYLKENAEFYVNSWVSPYQCKAEIYNADGKFYLNASGLNVNYYTGDVQINWNGFEPIPYGEQTFFFIREDGGNPRGDNGKEITFGKIANSGGKTVKFNYTVKIEKVEGVDTSVEWTLNEQPISNAGTIYLEGAGNDGSNGVEISKKLNLKSSRDLNPGEGIIITFRTPDDKMDMCEIRYIEGELLWTGASSTDILDTGNWSYDEIFSEGVLKEAIIGSGAVNYPEIDGNVTVSKLTVKNGARITVAEGGKLTVNSLIFEGNSKIDASAGKVIFTGTAENPSFEATYPEFSKFGTIEVQSGTFNLNYPLTLTQLKIVSGASFLTSKELVISSIENSGDFSTTGDLHITKSLTNNGTFTAGKVYLEPSENEVTITGQSGDSEITEIAELYCENQKGKTLVINGTISVGQIALSGVANEDNSRLTVKSGDNPGIIYLGGPCENARFLEFVDNSVKIETNKITVSEWDISNVTDIYNILKSNWVLTDLEEVHVWKGTENSDWGEAKNWNYWGVPNLDEKKSVRIPSGCTNYPNISSEITVKQLDIRNNAKLTVGANGNLNVEKLILSGLGKIDAAKGTVTFAGKGSAENPSFVVETPDLSNFGSLVVAENANFYTANNLYVANLTVKASASFTSISELHISTSLTNNGSFNAGTVRIEPSTIATITGNSNDSIANLICTEQGGKTLVINGTISVEKISLSGVENSFLTVKTSDSENSGKIYLGANCDANYLSFEKRKVVSIQNKVINVTKSDMTNIKAEVDFKSEFVEKNWRYADQTEFIWTGKIDNKWNANENWDFYAYPTNNNQTVTSVLIPSGCEKYPTLNVDVDLQNVNLTIAENASINFAEKTVTVKTIENGGEIDFAGSEVIAESIKNNGTVRLNGRETITGTIEENGTVYYKGTGNYPPSSSQKFSWGGKYKNLVIEDGFSGEMHGQDFGISDSLTFGDKEPISEKVQQDKYLFSLNGSSIKLSYKKDESVNIEATGNHVYNWNLAFSEAVSITSETGTVSFLGTENTFAKGLTLNAPNSDFSNDGTFSAGNGAISVKTKTFTNAGTIKAESGAISIKAKTFENAEGKTISAKTGFSCEITDIFKNEGTITSEGKLIVNPVETFTNTGTVYSTAESGAISVKTKTFTNAGAITAENGDISVTTKTFSNAEGNTISAKTGFSCEITDIFKNAGIITSEGNLIVNPVETFTNTGTVYSTAESGAISVIAKTFTNAGTIKAENGDISVTAKTFTNAEGKTISAKTGFSCEETETFKNEGTITSAGNLIVNPVETFTNTGTVYLTAESGAISITAKTFTNAGTITAENGDISVTTASSFENSGKLSGTSGLTIDALESLVSGTISSQEQINIAGNLCIVGKSEFSFGELSVGTDLVISAIDGDPQTAKSVSLTGGNINISGNFALFNGDVALNSNLSVKKDMIMLNGVNPSMFNDPISGIEGLFAYNLSGRGVEEKTAKINLENFPTSIPVTDSPISHEKYTSIFAIADEKTITVGKNFYSNGVDLGTEENLWTLKIPGNNSAALAFAESYNATIKNCTVLSDSEDDAWLSTENCIDGESNSNVAFSKAVLANVRTISDCIIEVSFVDKTSGNPIKIENSCNEISAWAATDNFRFNVIGTITAENPGMKFSGIYANPECTEDTNDKGDLSTFYLKYEIPTDGSPDCRWNTDATGDSVGSTDSTDTSGVHKEVVPNLGLVRALTASYAGLRDEHKNRLVSVGTGTTGAEPLYTDTVDNAPPALIAVSIGQEQHETDSDAQHHYDSHNFIEWRFSEPMDFGFGDKTENVLATDDFGTITNKENGFEIAGLGEFQNGKLVLGSKSAEKEISAFYYCDEKNYGDESVKTRLRLSIAGYVDEENPVIFNGENYKNWLGFIDGGKSENPSGESKNPFGSFSISPEILNRLKDSNQNNCASSENQTFSVNQLFLSMTDEQKAVTTYGTWDLDSPKVANYAREGFITSSNQELIAVDFSYSNKAEGIQIHILDNSLYNPTEESESFENLAWKTGRGWKVDGELITPSPIPLDTKGGSRMTGENQTSGGLRLSSIDVGSFSCENLITGEISTFNEFSQTTINEAFFGKSVENQFDVPYLALKFEKITENQFLNHNYQLSYSRKDENGNVRGFITDLAGNLLEDFVVTSPDKNPPDFLLSVGGVGKDKLFIIFSKPLDWKTGETADEGKLRRIVKSLSIFEKGGVDTGLIDFEKGSRARILTETDKSTGVEISLTRQVSYEEIKSLYIGVNVFESGALDSDGDKAGLDPIYGIPGNFSMLYDMFENPISAESKHIFTDFAVNALDVLYAYDGRDEETAIAGKGVLGGNQWLITDFSETPNPQNRVLADKDISIFATIKDEAANKENQDIFTMFADISPNKNATGKDFEVYTALNPRLWFADSIKFYDLETNNSTVSENFVTDNLVLEDGKVVGKIEAEISGERNQNFNYVIPNDVNNEESLNWDSGSEIQFVFKIYDADGKAIWVDGDVNGEIDKTLGSSDHPLYAVRLKDESDLTSIDLWSLNIQDIVQQKGGVTILNNVIDSSNDEKTVVEVDVTTAGNVTVQVLTLDGNVVKVLQRGRVETGKYYYHWDGKNKAGDSVARGMYFIRVVGPNLDETRKVMVVIN